MSIATVVAETQYSVVITDNSGATTIVTPPAAVSLIISTDGPAGPPGPGVPIGGDAGNILLKQTTANYDAGWAATVDGGTFN